MSARDLAQRLFSLQDRVAVITGGAGLLGVKHAQVIASAGGIPVLVDIDRARAEAQAAEIAETYGVPAWGTETDITKEAQVAALLGQVLERHGRVDILINNAARDPKVGGASTVALSRVENFPMEQWDADLEVGLKGAFICSQVVGGEMARRSRGVIVNIGSEYGVNGPDQRLYRQAGVAEEAQPVKPITYTVVKSGLVGMNRYFALYWGSRGVRVNAVSLGGVRQDQSDEFVRRYIEQVPLGRMAEANDYQGTILYLCSDASAFLTGTNLVIDGGKSCW
ncbi:MAG: SDR family oxidoreductase [Chthoniobacterales bacterium]|nr:SDR family oxidoreductase [Chthoniobacterales bacterium]